MNRRARTRAAILTTLAVSAGTLIQGIGATPASAEPIPVAERFVRQAYVDALDDADPIQPWIDAGIYQIERIQTDNQWLGALLVTDKGRLAFIESQYQDLLGRASVPAGSGPWLQRMKNGLSRPGLRGEIAGSREYYDRVSNGDRRTFVDNLYRDFLEREASDAGRAYWYARMDRGLGRVAMATEFGTIEEGRRIRAQRLFATYLDRAPTDGELAWYTARLGVASEESAIVQLTGTNEYRRIAYVLPAEEDVVLLSASGQLTTRRASGADTTVAVTGLTAGTNLVGIDVRPATGVLYGLGSDGQLYAVNRTNGVANRIGAPIPAFDAGAGVGFDFNPAADRVRVVTAAQNYRLQPDTGEVLGEGAAGTGLPGTIQYVADDPNAGKVPSVTAAAYVNSTRGLPLPTTTAMYSIDTANDVVAEQNPANSGNLITRGSLKLDATGVNGFDTSPDGEQLSYAVLTTARGQGLYRIDLATGEPKLLERLPADPIVGLAVLGEERVAPSEAVWGVSGDGLTLVSFTTTDPTPTASQAFAGLTAGTRIVGIDVRPSTGQLFAIGSDGQLYTVDTSVAGTATVSKANELTGQIGGGTFDASQGVAFDFNPAADRIRVVVGTDNYRVQTNGVVDGEGPPNTGLPGTIQYVPGDPGAGTTPKVSGAAYTNSFRSATLPTATALYDLETGRDVLVRQNPANAGDLTTIGPLGMNVDDVNGFDVSAAPGQNAYAVLGSGGDQALYLVDLATGRADKVGDISGSLSAMALK